MKEEITREIALLFQKEETLHLTVRQARDGLSAAARKALGLSPSLSLSACLVRLEPLLPSGIVPRKVGAQSFLSRAGDPDTLLLAVLARKKECTLGEMKLACFKTETRLAALNALLARGQVRCTRVSAGQTPYFAVAASSPWSPPAGEDDAGLMLAAIHTVAQGQLFIRIHKVRERLGWLRDRFDATLRQLVARGRIQLHGGDPTRLARQEVENSFEDGNGHLLITLTLRGESAP